MFIRQTVLRILLLVVVTVFCLNLKLPEVFSQGVCTDNQTGTQYVLNNGLATAPSLINNLIINNSTPGEPICVIDSTRAQSFQHAIPTFGELKSLYFDQIKESGDIVKHDLDDGGGNLQTRIDSNPNQYNLAFTTGDYSLNSLTFPSEASDKTVVFLFVRGNLTINQDLKHSNHTQGLILIVGGNVNVNDVDLTRTTDDVKEIDAFIITTGTFCSHWTGSCTQSVFTSPVGFPLALTIYGSIISLGNNEPLFYRNVGDVLNPENPSEIINYQPKYLVITRHVFGRNTKIWSEVQ